MITQMSRAIYPDKREVENWLTMNTKIKQLQSENGGLRFLPFVILAFKRVF